MKTKILEGTLVVFKKKGVHFTMDDLATELSMSKKTIYRIFPDKSTMLMELIDHVFDRIKEEEKKIYDDESLPSDKKFYQILCAFPVDMEDIDLTEMYCMKNRYPKHCRRLYQHLEEDWEMTMTVLHEAVEDGYFRPINEELLKLAYEASLERFLTGDDLKKMGVPFAVAMERLANVLVEGIRV